MEQRISLPKQSNIGLLRSYYYKLQKRDGTQIREGLSVAV
jgi:hypothetical protein